MSIPRNTEMTKRLLATFASATSQQVVAGLQWYPKHTSDIDAMADRLSVSRDRVAAVVAALSPRIQWVRNLQVAESTIRAFQQGRPVTDVSGVFTVNLLKSYEILRGNIDALNGDKTRAFYRNLSGDTNAVTVDVWAMRAAMGYDKQTITPKQYAAIARSYRAAAARVGITPRDFQAVVWCVERGRAS